MQLQLGGVLRQLHPPVPNLSRMWLHLLWQKMWHGKKEHQMESVGKEEDLWRSTTMGLLPNRYLLGKQLCYVRLKNTENPCTKSSLSQVAQAVPILLVQFWKITPHHVETHAHVRNCSAFYFGDLLLPKHALARQHIVPQNVFYNFKQTTYSETSHNEMFWNICETTFGVGSRNGRLHATTAS